jgi:hydroxymethylpyrimidine pyrophosphatase-like HAD family hydrolase
VSEALLLCTDLDRTLIPNGPAPESAGARDFFATLVARSEVCLAYVTGRDRRLVESAIGDYALPEPDIVIGDVGTTIYTLQDGDWQVWQSWRSHLAAEWNDGIRATLVELLADLSSLQLQEASKQGEFKISFYVNPELEAPSLLESVRQRIDRVGLSVRPVFSRDEAGLGLLDLLPQRAGKQAAIEHLMQ